MILNFIKGGYEKVKKALGKTRTALFSNLKTLIGKGINEEVLEELEELFYTSDLGVKTSSELVEKIRQIYQADSSITPEKIVESIKEEILALLNKQSSELYKTKKEEPTVVLVIGVNGNGKTTSSAKLAHSFAKSENKVLLAAADTFRAAATEQLEKWADKINVPLIKGQQTGDPSAIVFDAVTAAKARKSDLLIIDTAGRLQTKTDLMQELNKMQRVCKKVLPEAPHETLLVLDATTGQNAIDQAKVFNKFTPISGIILTKLDGTAKGGIVLAIQQELNIPVKFIGTGESIDDFEPFNAENFVDALFES